MELSSLVSGTAECTAKIGEGEINFSYEHGKMTLNYISQIDASFVSMAQVITDVVVSWDITVDDEPLEINEENVLLLPLEWVNKIFDTIFDDIRSEKN